MIGWNENLRTLGPPWQRLDIPGVDKATGVARAGGECGVAVPVPWACRGRCRAPQGRRCGRCPPGSRPPEAARPCWGCGGRSRRPGGAPGPGTAASPPPSPGPCPWRSSPPSVEERRGSEVRDQRSEVRGQVTGHKPCIPLARTRRFSWANPCHFYQQRAPRKETVVEKTTWRESVQICKEHIDRSKENWIQATVHGENGEARCRKNPGMGMLFIPRCWACFSYARDRGSVTLQNTWRDYVTICRRGNAPEMGVSTRQRPQTKSPNLNPIENLWGDIKKQNPKIHRNCGM